MFPYGCRALAHAFRASWLRTRFLSSVAAWATVASKTPKTPHLPCFQHFGTRKHRTCRTLAPWALQGAAPGFLRGHLGAPRGCPRVSSRPLGRSKGLPRVPSRALWARKGCPRVPWRVQSARNGSHRVPSGSRCTRNGRRGSVVRDHCALHLPRVLGSGPPCTLVFCSHPQGCLRLCREAF